jgi:hypothetical protein
MKYIKKFEELEPMPVNNSYNIQNRYAVWMGEEYEVLDTNLERNKNRNETDGIWCVVVYKYNKKTKTLDALINQPELNFNYDSNSIKYSSNDLQNCIDMLRGMVDIKKYNL